MLLQNIWPVETGLSNDVAVFAVVVEDATGVDEEAMV